MSVSVTNNSKELLSVFQQLTIQENSPGKDGMEYKLSCKASCPLISRSQNVPAYDIPFLFYNGELSVVSCVLLLFATWVFQHTTLFSFLFLFCFGELFVVSCFLSLFATWVFQHTTFFFLFSSPAMVSRLW